MELKLHNVNKTYDEKDILIDINLDIHDESGIAIIGPSGAGKSTLLRLLSLIEKPDSGEIHVNKYDLNEIEPEEYYKKIG